MAAHIQGHDTAMVSPGTLYLLGLLLLAGLMGLLFWPYWFSVVVLTTVARNAPPLGDPRLFTTACALQLVSAGLVVLLVLSATFIVGGRLAWCAWRKALLNVELERWREQEKMGTSAPARQEAQEHHLL